MSVTRNALMNWLIDKIPPKGYTPAPPLPDGRAPQARGGARSSFSSHELGSQSPAGAPSMPSSPPAESGRAEPLERPRSSGGSRRSSASHQQGLTTLQAGKQKRVG